MQIAQLNAQVVLLGAMRQALAPSLAQAQADLMGERDAAQSVQPEVSPEQRITLLFSGNNHGEREDCGCKGNPLGGLDRRATLVALARDPSQPDVEEHWGTKLAPSSAVLYVDAGDALFARPSLMQEPEAAQKLAQQQAVATRDGMNASPPDVANIGTLDLALGLDAFTTLRKGSKFPWISANLVDAKTQQPIAPPAQLMERGGKRVGFIGLIQRQPRQADYYTSRGVATLEPVEAYRAALASLPGELDAVVLLSNEGVEGSADVVSALRAQGLRVDAVIASGSNRMTQTPMWRENVPLVEPMSQGKYFGSLTLARAGDAPGYRYANDLPDITAQFGAYQRAWRNYLEVRLSIARDQEELLTTQAKQAVEAEAAPPAKEPAPGEKPAPVRMASPAKDLGARADALAARAQRAQPRLALLSAALLSAGAELEAAAKTVRAGKVSGTDWATLTVVPLRLDIPQQPAVRKVLDRYKGLDTKSFESKKGKQR